MSMNLKPLRDVDEHKVVNFFSTEEGDLTKGTLVQLVSFDPDNHNGYGASLDGVPDGAFSSSYEVYAKVKAATDITGTLGVLLCDVVSTNTNVFTVGDQLRYFDKIPSGKAAPVLTEGIITIAGFSGTAAPGLKGVVNTGVGADAGQIAVAAADTTPNVGTFLSSEGDDGYAVFKLNCQ